MCENFILELIEIKTALLTKQSLDELEISSIKGTMSTARKVNKCSRIIYANPKSL